MPIRTPALDLKQIAKQLPDPLRRVLWSLHHRMFRWGLHATAALLNFREQTFPSAANQDHDLRLPVPPPLLRYRVGEDMSVSRFLKVGQISSENLTRLFKQAGSPLSTSRKVLDFGCGCGRTLRWVMTAYPDVAFTGSDVDREAIEWNSANLAGARFTTNGEWPRLAFSDSEFDGVYAISVFTHLDREHQIAWSEELARIISPGGVLVLTVHGLALAGATATSPVESVLCRRTRKLQGIHPDWYQTAYNAESFTVEILRRYFSTVKYAKEGFGYQDAVLCRK
ncbi:MAG TPA: class I SAM-dependent methyltransferase [Bryobacteraceae bacterium]|nr:class I SAM-dependent methyltransferase [Bryobacteraceae bacterium]